MLVAFLSVKYITSQQKDMFSIKISLKPNISIKSPLATSLEHISKSHRDLSALHSYSKFDEMPF